jgi:hypothetical protein
VALGAQPRQATAAATLSPEAWSRWARRAASTISRAVSRGRRSRVSAARARAQRAASATACDGASTPIPRSERPSVTSASARRSRSSRVPQPVPDRGPGDPALRRPGQRRRERRPRRFALAPRGACVNGRAGVEERRPRQLGPALLEAGGRRLRPRLGDRLEQPLHRDLRCLMSAVSVGHDEQQARGPLGEAGCVLVGIQVGVALGGAAAGQCDRGRAFRHRCDTSEDLVVAPAQDGDVQRQPLGGDVAAGARSITTRREGDVVEATGPVHCVVLGAAREIS